METKLFWVFTLCRRFILGDFSVNLMLANCSNTNCQRGSAVFKTNFKGKINYFRIYSTSVLLLLDTKSASRVYRKGLKLNDKEIQKLEGRQKQYFMEAPQMIESPLKCRTQNLLDFKDLPCNPGPQMPVSS